MGLICITNVCVFLIILCSWFMFESDFVFLLGVEVVVHKSSLVELVCGKRGNCWSEEGTG